jgi:hypothetical protein
MLLVVLIGASLAHADEACLYTKGEREGHIQPFVAECLWDVPMAHIVALLSVPEDEDLYYRSVISSDPVEACAEGHTRVRQVHTAMGIPEREIIMRVGSEATATGMRFHWAKDESEAGLKGDMVRVGHNTGSWELSPAGAGTRVVYTIRYDPGGMLPSYLVRMLQNVGVERVIDDLHRHALATLPGH